MFRNAIRLGITLATLLPVWTTLNAAQIPGGFTQLDLQDGGYLTGLIQHRSGRLICRTDGGGIYGSDNGGFSWTFLSSNMVSYESLCVAGIAVPQTANSSSNLILQVTGANWSILLNDPYYGIWKSTDGGATWTQTLTGVNFWGDDQERMGGEPVIFHPTNDLEAWAGSYKQGLYKSMDSGSTWTQVSPSSGFTNTNIVSSIFIHPSYPDQIFVAGDGGVWASVNHGTNWSRVVTNSAVIMRITRGADGTVYYVGYNGSSHVVQKITSANWANPATYVITDLTPAYNSGGNNDTDAVTGVTVLRDGRLVVSDYAMTLISANQGQTFSQIPNAYVAGTVVPQWCSPAKVDRPDCIVQDPFASNTWYGGGGNSPIRTDDGGQHWQFIFNGIGEVCTCRTAFNPGDSNRLYIPCADNGGAIVTDNGLSGNTVAMIKGYYYTTDGLMGTRRAMASRSNGVNRVIFAGREQFHSTARVYMTTNDGTSWTTMAMTGLPTASGNYIIDAMDSLDNPDDFLVVCAGKSGPNAGGVYRTTNAGASFTQCNWYPSNSVDLTYGMSMDRDATNVNVRYLYAHAAFPASPLATNNGGGMFISTNRGVAWTEQTFPLMPGDWNDWQGTVVADHGISGSIWLTFTTFGPNEYGLMHSTDGGISWSPVGGFTNAVAADALSNNVCVIGQMTGDAWCKVYYSSNNGTNWDEITGPNHRIGNAVGVALDPHWPGRVFINSEERSTAIFIPTQSRATPAMTTWPTATTITYGQTLTASILNGGSASTGGSFAFTTPATAPGAGTASQSVTFTPTNTVFFSNVTGTVSVNVNPLPVVLTGTRPYNGTATAAATILSVSNALNGDNVNVAAGSATLAGASVGVQAISGFSGLALGGTKATNYTLTGASGTVTITNPYNPISIASALLDATGTNLIFSWQSVPGVVYTVLTNSTLTPMQGWSSAGSSITATNTTTSISLPGVVFTGSELFVAIKQQ